MVPCTNVAHLTLTFRPTFGFLRHIERSEFVDCIDNEPPSVFVVIHLFQEVSTTVRQKYRCKRHVRDGGRVIERRRGEREERGEGEQKEVKDRQILNSISNFLPLPLFPPLLPSSSSLTVAPCMPSTKSMSCATCYGVPSC